VRSTKLVSITGQAVWYWAFNADPG